MPGFCTCEQPANTISEICMTSNQGFFLFIIITRSLSSRILIYSELLK